MLIDVDGPLCSYSDGSLVFYQNSNHTYILGSYHCLFFSQITREEQMLRIEYNDL